MATACGYKPVNLVNHLTILKEEDGGDVTDAELSSQIIVLLYIALADIDLTIVSLSQLFNNGSDHTAGTTPCSPEIHYQRQIASLQTRKVLICNCYFHCFQYLKVNTKFIMFSANNMPLIDTIVETIGFLDIIDQRMTHIDATGLTAE